MGTRRAKLAAGILCLFLIFAIVYGLRRGKTAGPGQTAGVPPVIRTKTGIEMVLIPGGWFEMGSERGSPDERPVHSVWVGSFLMDGYEVTQELYDRFPLPNPSHFKDPKHPVEQMNWSDAGEYCNMRSRAEGLEACYDEETREWNFRANGYRLPTEAEWEYACRAGTSTDYVFGNDARRLKAYAWFTGNSSRRTHPVGGKRPNPWGLYDMHGNVAEWCNDRYSENYYKESPGKDPKGPDRGGKRVLRGGAWNSSPASCRSSYRVGDPSIDDTCLASDAIGFRCVRNLPADMVSEDRADANRERRISK